MPKLLVFGAVLALLDIFPGNMCGNRPNPPPRQCNTWCDCDQTKVTTEKCTGEWDCSPVQDHADLSVSLRAAA